MSFKTIEAVVESWSNEDDTPWPYIAISGYMSLNQALNNEKVGAIVQLACSYNSLEFRSNTEDTLRSFLDLDGFVLPGGLRFSESGQVKVLPGCCCGLENWRDWLLVSPEHCAIWTGHDPSPWVEYVEGQVKIWPDSDSAPSTAIAFSYEELTQLLKQVESDLQGFLVRLGQWAEHIAPSLKGEIVSYFAQHLHIPV